MLTILQSKEVSRITWDPTQGSQPILLAQSVNQTLASQGILRTQNIQEANREFPEAKAQRRDQAKNQGKQDLKHNQMNDLILDSFIRYHRAWKTS